MKSIIDDRHNAIDKAVEWLVSIGEMQRGYQSPYAEGYLDGIHLIFDQLEKEAKDALAKEKRMTNDKRRCNIKS